MEAPLALNVAVLPAQSNVGVRTGARMGVGTTVIGATAEAVQPLAVLVPVTT